MQWLENTLLPTLDRLNGYTSDYVLVILLLGCGVYFSIRTRFVQVRCFRQSIRTLGSEIKNSGSGYSHGVSSIQALLLSVGAQLGTGNIVGCSGAILTGGPGSIFWIWVIAFFGMATAYAETTLAIHTREPGDTGEFRGGPVYYIRCAFRGRFGRILAAVYAVALIISVGFIGCMVQANSVDEAMGFALEIPSWVIGALLVVLCGFAFMQRVSGLARIVGKVVPIMGFVYIVSALIILIARIRYIPEAFGLIFRYAFQPQAIIGGGFWYAIKTVIGQGAKRGLFSNEAGLGTQPHAHAQANAKSPHHQGLMAMVSLFIDTFVVLTLTGLVVVTTMYAGGGVLAGGVVPEGLGKTNLAQAAFSTVFGSTVGPILVALSLMCFAFSNMITWNMYGKLNVDYLTGGRKRKLWMTLFIVLALVFVMTGALVSNNLAWTFNDLANNIMVFPNVLALVALGGLVISYAREGERGWAEEKKALKRRK